MTHPASTPPIDPQQSARSNGSADDSDFLAQQLFALLEGSINRLAQARKELEQPPVKSAATDHALEHLHHAVHGLRQIILLVRDELAAICDQQSSPSLPHRANNSGSDKTIADCETLHHNSVANTSVSEVAERLGQWALQLAREADVRVSIHLHEEARNIPAGPLEVLVRHAIRYSGSGCRSDTPQCPLPSSVADVDIGLADANTLFLTVTCNQSGVDCSDEEDSAGRDTETYAIREFGDCGQAISICRQIIHDLGGVLRLVNIPFSRGCVFDARIPINSLRRRSHSAATACPGSLTSH